MRPSARHRSCRNNQSGTSRRRAIQEEEKRERNRFFKKHPGLLIPPSFSSCLLHILQTLCDGEESWQWERLSPLWPATLLIIELVEEEETCTSLGVTAEFVIKPLHRGNWSRSCGLNYLESLETIGSKLRVCWRISHDCSELIFIQDDTETSSVHYVSVTDFPLFHRQWWVFQVYLRFRLFVCTSFVFRYQKGLRCDRFSFFSFLFFNVIEEFEGRV